MKARADNFAIVLQSTFCPVVSMLNWSGVILDRIVHQEDLGLTAGEPEHFFGAHSQIFMKIYILIHLD